MYETTHKISPILFDNEVTWHDAQKFVPERFMTKLMFVCRFLLYAPKSPIAGLAFYVNLAQTDLR